MSSKTHKTFSQCVLNSQYFHEHYKEGKMRCDKLCFIFNSYITKHLISFYYFLRGRRGNWINIVYTIHSNGHSTLVLGFFFYSLIIFTALHILKSNVYKLIVVLLSQTHLYFPLINFINFRLE